MPSLRELQRGFAAAILFGDSAAGKHACAGQSTVDNDPISWKYVAKGTCEKVGGKMTAPKS